MTKKLFIIIAAVLIFLIASVMVALRMKSKAPVVSPLGSPVKEAELAEPTTWEDAAGFQFSYPKNIVIDPHEEDEGNYAHLELTSVEHPGQIVIWVKETDYEDIEVWLEETIPEAQVLDTELAGQPAKKLAYSDPQKLVTATIDVDALVLLEMTPDDEGYWQKVYGQILASFEFISLEGKEAVAPAPAGGGIIMESEEVIE